MTRQEARKKLFDFLHADWLSWTPDSVDVLQMAIDALGKDNDVPDKNVGDMISRQVVLNEIEEWISALYENAHHESASDGKMILNAIKHLPSAQPGIIRCRDCIAYKEGLDIDGKPFTRCNGINGSVRTYGHTLPDWYCADAERRTDEPEK